MTDPTGRDDSLYAHTTAGERAAGEPVKIPGKREPEVPAGTPPEDVDAPVVRDEETGEQKYPEQFVDDGPASEKGD